MFDDPQSTRRSLLAGTATTLSIGLAGCSSVLEDGGDDMPEGDAPATGERSSPTTHQNSSSSGADAGGTNRNQATFQAASETAHGVDLGYAPIVGSEDADVDIYYWSDYQCPFCKQFETEAYPKLLDEEVAAGTARIVFLQYPNIGSASTGAALLAKAVWRQVKTDAPGRFGAWHSHIFENQEKPNSGWADYENLLALTQEVDGVDASAADETVRNKQGKLAGVVRAEQQEGENSGISGTPGFMLYYPSGGDQLKLMGAQPYPRFEDAIATLTE